MKIDKIIIIIISIYLVTTVHIDMFSNFFEIHENSLSHFARYKYSEVEFNNIYLIYIIFIMQFATSYLIPSIRIKYNSRSDQHDLQMDSALTKYTSYIFICLIFLNLYKINQIGILNYLYNVRNGEKSLGLISYFLLIFGPIICSKLILQKQYLISSILVLLLTLFNLATGFRILLLWCVLVIFFTYLSQTRKINYKLIVLAVVLFCIAMLLYQNYRTLAGNGEIETHTLFDLLNRTKPISLALLSEQTGHEYNIIYSIKAFIDPFLIISKKIFGLFPNTISFSEEKIYLLNESLIRDFLIWRGTPNYEASGLSLNVFTFFYVTGGPVSQFIFNFLLIIGIKINIFLLTSSNLNIKILGIINACSIVYMLEDFTNALNILIWSTIFVFILNFTKICLKEIKH